MSLNKSPVKLCIFCYKTVTQTGINGKETEICSKFYKHLTNFLKTKPFSVTLPCEQVCCKDCEYLVVEFCEIKHQINCWELQLQWKLEMLVKVMTSADKVPSRVKALQQSFVGMLNCNESTSKGQLGYLKKDHCEFGQDAYHLFKKLRQQILSSCGKNLPRLQPQVVLKRLNQVDKIKSNANIGRLTTSDNATGNNTVNLEFAMGWLMSFGAVVYLQSLYSDCLNESGTDHDQILLDFESYGGSGSDLVEPLEEDCKGTFDHLNKRNEENNDSAIMERSDEGRAIHITLETENDSSSTSSDEDNEMMDLKHDPFLVDNSKSCDENTEKDIKNIQRFPPNVKSTIQIKRQVSKKKSNRAKPKFSCGLCKTSYKTYQVLRRHKTSAIHRFLEMKRFDNLKPTTNIKIEQNSNDLPEITQLIENEDNINATKEGKVNSDSSYSVPEEARSMRYNLRLQTKKSYCSTMNPANELDMDKYNKESQDLNSTNMLSSDESDLEDDNEYTSSSLNNNRIEENTEHDDESPPFYRCFLDNCKLKRIVFYKKSKLDQHKILHIRGQYQCKFCDKVEGSPIKLSLHETEMHSAIPSTSTNTRRNNSIYYCARCPFETQKEGIYFKHFASIHLKILGDRSTSWECEICKRKFVRGKSRSKSHFKTHHDTSGLEDPELHVKKCSENDCSAYFLTQEQLRVHKILKHSASSYDNQLDQLINDMIEKNDATGCYKCLFCMKESSRFFNIQNHVRTFHQQMIENQTETSARTRNGKRLICPEIKCTKTFETLKGLEVHKKLHGTFACLFCDEVSNYAIDLAQHEYQSHTHSNNSKEQLKKILKFKCSRCPRNFQRLAGYTNHFVNAHLNISTIQSVCSICKFQCHTESLREHHLRNHYIVGMDPEKVSSCSKCPAYFRTYNQLYCHMKKLHQDPTKPKLLIHKCDKCDSTFSNPLYLEKHLDKEHPQTNISHNFKCNKCSRYFIRDVSLKIHMKNIHSGKRLENLKIHNIPKDNVNYPHQCFLDRCKRRFKDDKSLKLHQNLHKRGKYSCKFCDTVLDSILKLSMHESLYHSKKKGNKNNLYNCSRCQFENKSAKIYHTHFAQKHMGVIVKLKSSLNEKILGKHNCKFCEKEFVSASELGYHEAEHANKNTKAEEGKRPRIQCPRCHNTYTKLFYIKHYLKVHFGCTKKKQTVCPICQEKAVSPKKHFRKYHKTDDLEDPSNIYKCEGEDDNCNAYFIEYVQLIQHKRKTHQQLNGWACKDCDKKYSCEKGLQSHIRNSHAHLLENPNLPFPCDKGSCKRRFGTKGELEHHKKFARHKNCEVQVKCEKCNKEFLNKSTLKTHLNKSHSERSFFCQECGKVFKTKGNLKNHLEYHKGPDSWKFQCSTCGKKCVSKNVLDAHLRTHTGEKPYVCQYCGEKYAHIHNWKNHMLTKHKDEEDLPKIRKTPSTNRISRKGTKKGACVISEVQQ